MCSNELSRTRAEEARRKISENQIRKDKIRPAHFSCLVAPSSRAVAEKGVSLAKLQEPARKGEAKRQKLQARQEIRPAATGMSISRDGQL